MSKEKLFISKRLDEVRAVKEAIYREVAHLPLDRAIDEILKQARKAAARYNLPYRSPLPHAIRFKR